MSYSSLIATETKVQDYLVVMKPRRLVTTWTLVSGSVYSKPFSYGEVVSLEEDGNALSAGSSPSLSAGQFYYDVAAGTLYVRTTGSANPSTVTLVAIYELYFSRLGAHWYRDPLDTASREVYFEGFIEKDPELTSDASKSIFGVFASESSQLVLKNNESSLEKHLYDSSFSSAEVRIYHALKKHPSKDLTVSDIKLIYDGICGDYRLSGNLVNFTVKSFISELDKEFRNSVSSFYSTALFPEVDPNFVGSPIRYVYGMVDGFAPVNVDYLSDAPTTSDNRVFSCIGEQTNLANITATVGGGTHTTTRTYVNSAQGLNIDDAVWMNRAAGTDEYVSITNVDRIANYIEHEALATPMTNGDTVERSFVGAIVIVQDNVKYFPKFNRDFTTAPGLAGGCAGFTLSSSLEANLSMPKTLSPNDQIYCRVYGRKNDLTLDGSGFGSNDSVSGNIASTAMVLLDLFKRVMGISESKLNIDSFTDLLASRPDAMGFAVPESSRNDFPTVKDVVLDIVQSTLVRITQDSDLKWKFEAISPMGSSDYEINDEELGKDGISFEYKYAEVLSEVIVQYARREIANDIAKTDESYESVTAESKIAKYVHKVKKSKTFKSLHFKKTEAQKLADRLSYLLGDRQGTVDIQAQGQFFEAGLGSIFTVSRTRLPGFDFDKDIERSRQLIVDRVARSTEKVSLELNDFKGVQDNQSSW